MRFAKFLICSMLLAFAVTLVAQANPNAPAAGDPPIRKLNGHLVESKGRGLYTWDGDTKGSTSQCNAQCRILWPPLFAAEGALPKGPFDLVKREDGRYQWALKGRPLYRWASDKKWGDAGGDGVGGVWHLVVVAAPKPAAMRVPSPEPMPAPQPAPEK